MAKLSDRINALSESETIAMSQKSRELQSQGINVINLSLGEPDFNTPDFVKDSAKKAIDDNFSHYPPVPGFVELKAAICKKLERDNGLHYKPNQIVVSTGAKQSIVNAVLCLVNPGDEVLLPSPYWVSYREMVKMAFGEVVEIPAGIEQQFKISPSQLEAAITDKTVMMIFSSPNNPTGSAYTEAELRALAEVLKKYPQVTVLSDEIYEHIRYEGKHFSLASIPEMYDRVITVNGVSKAFAMTGWRIGYMAGPEEIAAACTKMQGQFTSGASTISQKAAEKAMNTDPSALQYMIKAFESRRKIMIEGIGSIEGFEANEPEGAFYLFPKVSSLFGKSASGHLIKDATDLSMYLLEIGHVATVAGSAFGAPEYLRLSYAASESDLYEAISRIKQAVAALK